MPATSEPAPGSVIPSAPIFSPAIPGTSQRCFCSSVPKLKIGGIAIEVWALSPAATPPEPPRAGQLLDPDRVVQVGAALAAVLLGELQPEEAELGAAPVELAGEFARLLPLVDVGRDLLGDEAADGLAQLLVLLAEGGRVARAPRVLDDGHRRGRLAPVLEHRVAAAGVVEAEQVALRVLLAAVVVGADLGDLAVADQEPLGAAVEARLAALRVAPGHRPLDRDLVALLDRVLQVPVALDALDREGRVACRSSRPPRAGRDACSSGPRRR